MPNARFHRLPLERQREILDVAARHFAAEGLAGAAINRILADCGLSKGSAYYYFEDKDDLFATVVEEGWRGVVTDFDPAALDADGFWPALERLYRAQILSFADRPWLWPLSRVARDALKDPQTSEALQARLGPPLLALDAMVARGMALGCVRTDLPRGLLVAMFTGLDDGIDTWLAANPDVVRGPGGSELLGLTFDALRRVMAPRSKERP